MPGSSTIQRASDSRRPSSSLGPFRRLLVVFAYCLGFGLFLIALVLSVAVVPPDGPLPAWVWRVLILVGGIAAVVAHMFVGYLIGGRLDGMRTSLGRGRDDEDEVAEVR